MKVEQRIVALLEKHGWVRDEDTYHKEDVTSIQFTDNEIVFLSDVGDWLHVPINYYALVGVLVENRLIPYNF